MIFQHCMALDVVKGDIGDDGDALGGACFPSFYRGRASLSTRLRECSARLDVRSIVDVFQPSLSKFKL
jgi:hypothetical protein